MNLESILKSNREILLLYHVINWLVVGFVYGQEERSLNSCMEFTGTRPHIWDKPLPVYYYPNDPRALSLYDRSQLDTVNIFLHRQFNCSHDRPIQWVFHLDSEDNSMDVEIDFSERVFSSNDGQVEQHTANFRLLYQSRDLRTDMLFSCEPVPLHHPCERNFIQVANRNIEKIPKPVPTDSLSSLSKALLNSSLKNDMGEYDSTEENCQLFLIIKVEEGNIISYKWEGKILDNEVYLTNETAYFNNLFRLQKYATGPQCVKWLKQNEDCSNCQYVGEVRNYTLNGVIFHASYGNNQYRNYKGYFSVPKGDRSNRKFYFNWEISREIIRNEMIQILLPKPIFANNSFEATCRVSTFLFAYGTIISDMSSPDDEKSRPTEYYSPHGYRDVKLTMLFNVSNEPKLVSCFAPLKKSEHWIVKFEQIFVEEAIAPVINENRNLTEFYTLSQGEAGVIAECPNVTGNPQPTLSWKFPSKMSKGNRDKLEISNGKGFSRIIFPPWNVDYSGTYVCEVINSFGKKSKSITFQTKQTEKASKTAVVISSSLGGCTILLGFIISILVWKIRRQRKDFEIQTQKAIEEFKNGIKSEGKVFENELDPNFSVMQLPYNENFEVSADKWKIEDKILGSGQFGVVKMGQVIYKGEWIKVAVKTLKSAVEIDEFKSFLFELKIMAYLGQHKHIVSLISACTEGINERNIFIGVEFCDNGCLLDHIRKLRGSFQNMVTADGKISTDRSFLNKNEQYANISAFTTHDLYRWSYHVACGMEYLAMRKVLHGDLAARNVLLTSRKVAKVGDFGLSRVLMNSENYTKRTQTALPWKWMAPESLKSRVFSVNSDVWAYGVLLYEIFSVGQAPYPGIGWSPDFVRQLEGGLRMEKPVFCTVSVYKIMQSCWEHQPHSRPSYVNVKRKLSKGLHRLSTVLRNTHLDTISLSAPESEQNSTRTVAPMREATLLMDEIGAYSNLQPRGTNYYKNC